MDNLDAMIVKALSDEYEPEEYLILRTVSAAYENRKQDITLVNLIFIANMLWVAIAVIASVYLAFGVVRYISFFLILTWLSAIIPIYFIARAKFTKVNC